MAAVAETLARIRFRQHRGICGHILRQAAIWAWAFRSVTHLTLM